MIFTFQEQPRRHQDHRVPGDGQRQERRLVQDRATGGAGERRSVVGRNAPRRFADRRQPDQRPEGALDHQRLSDADVP